METQVIGIILQFVVLLAGLIGFVIKFNNKTEKNSIMIDNLEKNIASVKEDTKENYSKLEKKISEVEDDLKTLPRDISEIKVMIGKLSEEKE